ncbi:MAG: VWA domain-containing protein, partial [Candidatus Tectomicrobia bacterium]|nr:VWA domain-containing protein [Candidatus Tectomicrobia bacterium]
MENSGPIYSGRQGGSPQEKAGTSKPLPLDVAVVVDCSKSMKEKMGKVKQAIGYFLDRLDKETRVGLVTFGAGGVQVQQGLTSNIGFLKNILNDLDAGGSSLIGSALTLALDLLQDKEAIKVMVLFTDGWSQREEGVARTVSERVKSQGIRLITLGLGGEVNQGFLQELASSSADSYLFAEGSKLTGRLLRIASYLRKTDYFPVKLAFLSPELSLPFDLFVREGEATYLPFRARGTLLGPEGQQELVEKGKEIAFIRGQDRETYRTYLETCLAQGLGDQEQILEEKGKVVYEGTASLIEEIFEDPSKGGSIQQAADAVRQVLDFVFSLSSGKRPFYERLATFLSH